MQSHEVHIQSTVFKAQHKTDSFPRYALNLLFLNTQHIHIQSKAKHPLYNIQGVWNVLLLMLINQI